MDEHEEFVLLARQHLASPWRVRGKESGTKQEQTTCSICVPQH